MTARATGQDDAARDGASDDQGEDHQREDNAKPSREGYPAPVARLDGLRQGGEMVSGGRAGGHDSGFGRRCRRELVESRALFWAHGRLRPHRSSSANCARSRFKARD